MAGKKHENQVSSAIPMEVRKASPRRHNKHSPMTHVASLPSALSVADYFVWKGQETGNPVSNKKLQKLLYYAQAWSLALNNKKIFQEDIEAWVHGPAIRNVYFEFKDFGFSPIKKEVDVARLQLTEESKGLLDEIWRVYGKYDAQYLELLSHSEKPWQEARAGLDSDKPSDAVITPEAMRVFYSALKEKTRDRAE